MLRPLSAFLLLSYFVTFVACEKILPKEFESKKSTINEDESHWTGRNCMDCHYTSGKGEGWFTIAGSVDRPPRDSSWVEVYSDELGRGDLLYSLPIDKLGNFYTTDEFDMLNGYYVSIANSNGHRAFMQDKVHIGSCNLCHGSETGTLSFE